MASTQQTNVARDGRKRNVHGDETVAEAQIAGRYSIVRGAGAKLRSRS
jgi:hypothetical protein